MKTNKDMNKKNKTREYTKSELRQYIQYAEIEKKEWSSFIKECKKRLATKK